MNSCTSDFPHSCNETGKYLDPSGVGKIPFGLGPFLDCEPDEKNGIIITIISIIKFGFCPSFHVIVTCDCTVLSFGICRSFSLNLPNGEFQLQCQGAFSLIWMFKRNHLERQHSLITISETKLIYLSCLSTYTSHGLINSFSEALSRN